MGTMLDTPKIWQDPDLVQENIPAEIIPEEIELPSIAEQRETITSSNLSNSNKALLESLVTMNEVAQTLDKIRYTETADMRLNYIKMLAENFISSRMYNNHIAEELKRKLIERLLNHVDDLDFELATRLYTDLHETTNLDAQQAFATVSGTSATIPGMAGNGINLTINNATSEGASIMNNTLNATPQQVGQLKEVQAMNASIKGWAGNIPLPKRKQE